MKILNNKVLILPKGHYTSDGDFELFDSFNPERHWSVSGLVLMLPNRLICNHKQIEELRKNRNPVTQPMIQQAVYHSLEYGTENQLQVGDMVWFRYNNNSVLIEEGQYIEVDGKKMLLVDYDSLYMAVRGKEKISLNGWVFVEPVDYTKEDLKRLGGGIDRWTKIDKAPGVGIVRLSGIGNTGYFDGRPEGQAIETGKKVLFRKTLDVPVEWAYHKELNEGKYPWYRMHQKDILAIMD